MFKKVLIANRGEIAVRIMRTCREMGIETVAVYSDVDRLSSHVLEADEAVHIGKGEPSQSYLNIERIISAAESTGSGAIHPGYGFLAENPEFAEGCEQSGITFIGPPSSVMKDLGNKTVARNIMKSAGVPVIPGMLEPETDAARLREEAQNIGYPVLVKAVSGGGGKGMRVVKEAHDLEDACNAAMNEAQKAFGNGSIYLEKCLELPRHVEFQILADHHGTTIHLFERECSIQRRHQKIIEETPSPALTPELRRTMGEAAVSAARASGYVNAGTIEFVLDRSGRFYFLEVNTRLQVEHPITEMTTATDIVRLQLEIAAGGAIPFRQEELSQRGHAVECRIYAEDPEAGFAPAPGKILMHREPSGPGIRNDSGVYSGFEVPVEYDPILSKVIAAAGTREAARRRMLRALENYVILGIPTTIPFLIDVLESPEFVNGHTHTNFVESRFEGWKQDAGEADTARIAYLLSEKPPIYRPYAKEKATRPASPWETLGDWTI